MDLQMIRRTKLVSPRGLTTLSAVLVLILYLLPADTSGGAHSAFAQQFSGRSRTLLTAKGRGNRTTTAVTVTGRWTLSWSYSCGAKRRRFQVAVYRRRHHTPLAQMTVRGFQGRGNWQVTKGGTVHLVIKTACAWRVTMAQPAPAPTPSPTTTATPSPSATPSPTVGTGLALRVSGNQIVNQQGQAIRLIGINVPGSAQCIPTGPHTPEGIFAFPSASQTAAAIAGWHADVVRITLNEDCWLGINGGNPASTGENYRAAVISFIADLHAAGLYVILDLHANAPGTTPSTSQQAMADADHALAFWTSVAGTFKGDPAVIFEPYNEPHITTANAQTTNPWQCWRDGCLIDELDQYHNTPIVGAAPWQAAGMQSLVDAIRATGAANPILIDGLNWAQDLTQMLQYLPTDPQNQLIADYHNYMSAGSKNTAAYWNSVIAPVAARMPVMTSEVGEKDCGSGYVMHYMQWADAHGVGYAPWVWMTWQCNAMGLIADWNGTPSAYGQTFYDHFHAVSLVTG
ncbi:MAG TPA: cellulase family glycosylhydrolase [Chloroflexota bacterium]|nr:cellulase family glycosylhydrolase [Chloroflexota bacterium]